VVFAYSSDEKYISCFVYFSSLLFACCCADEPQYWWFEIFLLLNKTIMCGGLVMAAPGTPVQVLLAMLVMLSHMLVVLKIAPYDSFGEDLSSFLSSLTLTLTTLAGFALMTDHPNPAEKTFNDEVVANFLVVLAVLCISSQCIITILYDCGLKDRTCTQNCANTNTETTKVMPALFPDEQAKVAHSNAVQAWNLG
jgi:uncharacterized membrane protein